MIKWEKRIIDFLEKHMLFLTVLFISAIAFLLRRQNIWFYTEDYIFYFDGHDKNVQSALYYLLVKLVGYGFEIPLQGIKWLAGMADFAVAFLCVILCKKQGNISGKLIIEKWKLLLLYAACLFAPVVYLRGCVWAQVDSMALALLLGGACAWEYSDKRGVVAAVILGAMGVALYPPFMLLAAWYCICVKNKEAVFAKYLWIMVAAVAVLLEILSAAAMGLPWKQGWLSFINWTTYHPHTGVVYKSPADWMWQQLLFFSYGTAVLGLIAAFRRKISVPVAIALQILLAICYSVALGW